MVRRYTLALIGIASLLTITACGAAQATTKHRPTKAKKAVAFKWHTLAAVESVAQPAVIALSQGKYIVGTTSGAVKEYTGKQWGPVTSVSLPVAFLGSTTDGSLIIEGYDSFQQQIGFWQYNPKTTSLNFPEPPVSDSIQPLGTAVSPAGAVYVALQLTGSGTPQGVLYTYSPSTNQWGKVGAVSPSGPIAYANGKLAVTTESGVVVLNDQLQRIETAKYQSPFPATSPNQLISSIAFDGQGNLIIGTKTPQETGYGVWEYTNTTGWQQVIGKSKTPPTFDVAAVAVVGDVIIATTEYRGLQEYKDDRWTRVSRNKVFESECFSQASAYSLEPIAVEQSGAVAAVCPSGTLSSAPSVVRYGPVNNPAH